MLTTPALPRVLDDAVDCLNQTQLLIGLTQQQNTSVRGDFTTFKIGLNTAALYGGKLHWIVVTFCHGKVALELLFGDLILRD
ncbi:hypothetical protein GCM10007876_19800 [Litoribrevibacter albus]|uniref:Uncharacterized protein n=1 Tax=Litoribrevibacter albus TaxID=1473156 RepID=A0AA37SAE2_9GAMM|nr:hypothetical protein GCM10007876_19800 [Litoribrevibacter albus]